MPKHHRRRAAQPRPVSLSLDWFTDIHDIHTVETPLTTPGDDEKIFVSVDGGLSSSMGVRGVWGEGGVESVESVDNCIPHTTTPDARGCHGTLAEHKRAELMCALTLKTWGIPNPWFFLERRTTSQILEGLDVMARLWLKGEEFEDPAAYLFTLLSPYQGERRVHR